MKKTLLFILIIVLNAFPIGVYFIEKEISIYTAETFALYPSSVCKSISLMLFCSLTCTLSALFQHLKNKYGILVPMILSAGFNMCTFTLGFFLFGELSSYALTLIFFFTVYAAILFFANRNCKPPKMQNN